MSTTTPSDRPVTGSGPGDTALRKPRLLEWVAKASLIQTPDGAGVLGDQPSYLPNTNLETISDWLTKVIVGVGLVEIREVIAWVSEVGQVAGAAMDGAARYARAWRSRSYA